MMKTLLLGAGLAIFLIAGAGAQTPPQQPNLPVDSPAIPSDRLAGIKDINKHPLIFYVAKGPAGACGEGCDSWIAAEGNFDLAAAGRLRAVLKRLGDRKLPIYFQSAGGLVGSSYEIGRILRQRKMTAGVARTVPQGCTAGQPDDDACRRLKETAHDVPADLRENGALCASACVYAFIGATARLVPPGATLGVHSPRSFIRFPNGRLVLGTADSDRKAIARSKQYVTSMGIDAGLMEAVTSVSFEQRRILTREEIARFKIDTRDFSETRWKVDAQRNGRLLAYKFVVQADTGNAKYLSRAFAIACSGWRSDMWFRYQRDGALAAGEKIGPIRIDVGERPIWLNPRIARVSGEKEYRDGMIAIAQFRSAAALKSIDVSETVDTSMRQFKLSTAGLSDALDELVKSCQRR
jgi:hypothetical protein